MPELSPLELSIVNGCELNARGFQIVAMLGIHAEYAHSGGKNGRTSYKSEKAEDFNAAKHAYE